MRLSAFFILAMIGASVVSASAVPAPDVLFRGTAGPTLTRTNTGWCAVDVGSSLFQRSTTQQALISLPAVHYVVAGATSGDAPTYFTLSGHARMVFSGSDKGTLKFDEPSAYPVDVQQPKFSNYSEVYDSAKQRLIVKFKIKFGSCTVPVATTYWN